MTDRKEKLAVLADYAEELGLADVAEMLRKQTMRDFVRVGWALGYFQGHEDGRSGLKHDAEQLLALADQAVEKFNHAPLNPFTDTTPLRDTR